MNNQEDEARQLLMDLVEDESFGAFNADTKRLALAEFRRARFQNRLFLITKIAAVFGLIAGVAVLMRSNRELAPEPKRILLANQPILRTGVGARSEFETAADKELVAQFPPNTCFVAEVEGQKVLVFNSPELREKYLR